MDTMVQPKITGYRQLTEEEVALMNEGKLLANVCGVYIEKLRLHTDSKTHTGGGAEPPLDQRWVSIGATQIQQGFMAVMRGIAKPDGF